MCTKHLLTEKKSPTIFMHGR